jgi:ubiquinone biosynthesis protein Coq4
VYISWASRAGREGAFLLNVTYEEEFETPIAKLRRRLNIRVSPELPDTSHYYYKAAAAAASASSA